VDISKNTLGISPEKLNGFFKKNTKKGADGFLYNQQTGRRIAACLPVHALGFPCEINEIIEICNQYKLPVIEDAAEALGSRYNDQHVGTFGQLGVFSFNGNKIVTAGGGGMIVTNDKGLATRAKHLTTQAKVAHTWEYIHDEKGYNYRMPNLNAALLCAQLENLDLYLKNKRKLALAYQAFFKKTEIEFLNEPTGCQANFWLNSILFSSKSARDQFLKFTNQHGVMTRPIWKLLSTLPMYRDCFSTNLETAKNIADRLVNIPSSIRIKDL
jgi:dTDP-4-amino-4,6-dideoxygalactose transaminase